VTLPKERRFVAVSDPLAAGFEAVEGWFATTAADLARDASSQPEDASFAAWWRRGGFDRVEKHDDRVQLFATRLSEGRHEFSYLVRATSAGSFSAAGTYAEEMYAPEVFGRAAAATVVIK
jgi:alpha-2-macroglobulin